jgi:hypothetical protein
MRIFGFQSQLPQPPPPPKQPAPVENDTPQRALDTLQYLASLVGGFRNPEQQIIGYAVIAEALVLPDRDKARQYLRRAYATLEKLEANPGDTGPLNARTTAAKKTQWRELRNELLSRIQRIDPALARELTHTPDKKPSSPEPDPAGTQRRRASQKLQAAALMSQAVHMLETDPAAAVARAEQSLALGIAPGISAFLIRLQQRDPALADQLFTMAFTTATRIVPPEMGDLLALATYVFPSVFQARQQRPTDPARARLFLQALATSLLNAPWLDNPSGDQTLYYQAAQQYLVVQRLLPMYERFAPNLMDDLNQILDQVMGSVPGRFQNKLITASQSSDPVDALTRNAENETDSRQRDQIYAQAAVVAAGHGDVARAQQLSHRIINPQLRQDTDEQIIYVGTQATIDKEQWDQARKLAMTARDPITRADLLIQAGSRLVEQKQPEPAASMLNQAYTVLMPLDPSEDKARYLFTMATTMLEAEPLRVAEIAQAGVAVLNKLSAAKNDDAKTHTDVGVPLTPRHIRQQLEVSFSQLGHADFERAISISMQLQNLEQRVIAQAASCREALLGQARTTQSAKQP